MEKITFTYYYPGDSTRQRVFYDGNYYGDIIKGRWFWKLDTGETLKDTKLRKNKLKVAKFLIEKGNILPLPVLAEQPINSDDLEKFLWPGLTEIFDAVKIRRERLYGYCDVNYPVTPEETYLATRWEYLT